MKHVLAVCTGLVVAACARAPRIERIQPSAIDGDTVLVDAHHEGADGAGTIPTYRTIGAALAATSRGRGRRHTVTIRAGRYREKLTVRVPDVALVGESRDSTVLTFDAASDTPNPAGGTYGTRGSFTLRVLAPGFRAEHLTIENAFDEAGNRAKPDGDPTKLRNVQAVALMLDSASDRASLEDVRLLGRQDTFFPNSGRAYLHHCMIAGHVDFIFGAGQVVFDDCDIVSLDRGDPSNNGYITAPSTSMAMPYGFLFVHSRLEKESPRMAAGSVALGRPWHPGADRKAQGSAVFIECWMDDHISAKGWDRMSSVDSATQVRYWFEPSSARFFEYRSTGPGALARPTRRVLSDGDVRGYTMEDVLRGWNGKE
jgi:pectinesterase